MKEYIVKDIETDTFSIFYIKEVIRRRTLDVTETIVPAPGCLSAQIKYKQQVEDSRLYFVGYPGTDVLDLLHATSYEEAADEAIKKLVEDAKQWEEERHLELVGEVSA